MKETQILIKKMLKNHKLHKKLIAVMLSFSMLILFLVPLGLITPAVSLTENNNYGEMSTLSLTSETRSANSDNIPNGAYNFKSRITSISFSDSEGGNFSSEYNAGDADSASMWFKVGYSFSDTGDISLDQPFIYLTLPKDKINVLSNFSNQNTYDETDGWKAYAQTHSLGQNPVAATYSVYKTDNENDGLVVIHLTDDYIRYVTNNNNFQGALAFEGSVDRDATQDGDVTINLGSATATINFDDRTPSVKKTGSVDASKVNENGIPYIHWTIKVSDLYELDKYTISDTKIGSIVEGSFSSTPNLFYLNDGTIKTDLSSNKIKDITIEYDTLATEAELINNNATNTVTISGPNTNATANGEVTLNSNTKANIEKKGTPSYEVADEKGYIYWTVTVSRKYGMNLNGYKLTDTQLNNATIVSAVDENGNDITSKITRNGSDLTFNNDSNISKAVITYKSSVTENQNSNITNKAEIIPPSGTTPDDTKEITVTYDDTSLFNIQKTGYFNEDSTGGNNDYIEWTITIDASTKNNSKETLNGYVISDEAFGKFGFELISAEAFNDNSKDNTINNVSDIITGSGTSYTVQNKNIDKLILKYKLPLSDEEKSQRSSLNVGQTMLVTNKVTVTPSDGSPKEENGTVDVPGVAGIMSIKANKNWQGGDSNRPTSVKLQLQQKLDTNGTWEDYGTAITVNDNETYTWDKLPKRESESRKNYYYRVVEVNPPSEYTPSYSINNDDGTNTDGALITVTNTWNYINLGVGKNWDKISDDDKPNTVTFKILQSTDQSTWVDTGKTITLNKSDNFAVKFVEKLPKKDSNDNDLYYKIEETSAKDSNGNEILQDFTVTYGSLNSIKASEYTSDPTITATNTWNNLNVTVHKKWVGDEGYEDNRPPITLTLWKQVGEGDWVVTDKTVTINNDRSSDTDIHIWKNLPKSENGQSVKYKVQETPVANYYVTGEDISLTETGTITITNNYSNIKISASKRWENDTPDARPETVTFRIQQCLNQWGADSDWTVVTGKKDITLTRNEDGSFGDAVWEGLPKKDSNNQNIYYRVIEINISPDYTSSVNITSGLNENGTFIITNTWNFMNLTAEKQWTGDTGHESSRPNITLTLWKKVGDGNWQSTNQSVTLKNDDTSKPVNSYTWKKLPTKEDNQPVVYKVVETPVLGYDVSYSTESVNTSGTVTITNTSNHINITGVKQFVGDIPENRPSTITFKLFSSTTPEDESSWTEVNGSERTITKNSNNEFNNVSWGKLAGKDTDGHRIYYKIVETDAQDLTGKSILDDYDVTYSAPNGISESSSITVTNTWKYMNLSVEKQWSGFTDEELDNLNIYEIQVRLVQKIGETGVWTLVENKEIQTITKSNDWKLDNAWEKLPRKTEDGIDIYYRVEEVTTSNKFNARYDNGRNDTGTTVVTNVSSHINITAHKEWSPANPIYSSKPDSIEFTLMQTIDGGAIWTQVGEAKTLTKDGNYADVSWENLPTKDTATGYDIVYKVVEKSIDGFSVSYSNENITQTETVTITNTENSPYTKRGLYPTPNTVTDGVVTAEEYDFISEISPDRLPDLVKTIDGEEYYIFKWRLDFIKNQINGQTGMEYTITDTLPKGTILYINGLEYDVVWRLNNMGDAIYSYTALADWEIAQGKVPFTYENDVITFNIPGNMSQITYYTATLKSVIDDELIENGSYRLVNRVQEAKEKSPTEATVSIKDNDTADYIKKTNNTSSGTDENGNPKMSNGNAYYTLDINKDGRFLSNGSTVNISDVFQILRYQSGELDQSGRNILNASLENVAVYEVDSNGKRTLFSADRYSYSTKTEDGISVSESILATYSNQDINLSDNGLMFYTWNGNVPKGLEVVIQIGGGQPNAELTVTGNENIKAEPIDSHYDADGNAKIKVTFLKDFDKGATNIGSVSISNKKDNFTRNMLTAVVKQETEVTNNIINFTVPDGKHLQIEYSYKLKKTDNTDLLDGDFVTMQNSATIHTSGGDKTGDSDAIRFVVKKTSSTIQSSGVPKIKKIDIGNYSITNLNATFKLAKFDTESKQWIYATDFPFKVDDQGVVSKTDHTISFKDAEKESNGTIPESAKNLEVTNGSFNIVFEEDTLYKLIEIKAPNGFIKTPYELGMTNLNNMTDFTHYFIYKKAETTDMTALKNSANITMQVQEIDSNINIENIRPVKIGVSKKWEQDPESATKDVSVTVQLFQSHTKSAEIPADAVPVADASKYIAKSVDSTQPKDGTWILKKEYDSTTNSYIWQDDEIWHNLPDGADGKPIYYYVKEIAYSIGGTTYTLNANGDYIDNTGKVYTDTNGTEGQYKPTYADNGTNNDGIISITNSREFVVKKQWLNRDGSIMKNPPSEYSEIEFTLKGIKEDGTEVNIALGENNKLSSANDWKVEIPQYLVSQYSKFKIQEVNAPYFYIVSDIYSLNGSVGVVTLINQSQEISEIDVSVNKIWGDGDDIHTDEDVTVTLYKYVGARRFNNNEIKNFETSLPSGVTPVETIDPEKTITNPIQLNKDNDWSYTWTNLPYKENGTIVKYYAVETVGNEKYVSSYEYTNNDSSQHMDITNSLPGAITIKKRWIDAEDGSILTSGVPSEVKVQIYRTTDTNTPTTPDAPNPDENPSTPTITEPIKIMALGDSITDGYNIAGAYRQYLYKQLVNTYEYKTESGGPLIDMVGLKGWSGDKDYDDDNEGYSGYAIKKYTDSPGRAGLYEEIVTNNTISNNKPDIIILMIGTNDILDNKMGTVDGGTENIKERLQSLVDYIYSQYSNPKDLTLFIANPTPLGPEQVPDYLYNVADKQVALNANIATYSTYIQEIVASEKAKNHDVVFVNVNSQLKMDNVDLRADQIHPTETGFEKMGNYFAEVINAYLKGETLDDTTTDDDSSSTDTPSIDPDKLELVTDAEDSGISKDGTVTLSADNGWSVSLTNLPVSDGTNEYVYYVKEVNGDYYEVKYTNNGQKPGSNQIITVENTTEGNPISITAKKKWEGIPENSEITHPNTVTLQLLAADTKDGTYSAFGSAVTIGEEQNWSYTWNNLKGSKFYKVEETTIPDGWTVTYENNDGTQTDGDVITVTNTLDTGSLELNKSWYQDTDGGTSEVEVEVYRVAEDIEQYMFSNSLMLYAAASNTTTETYDKLPDSYNVYSKTRFSLDSKYTDLGATSIEVVFDNPNGSSYDFTMYINALKEEWNWQGDQEIYYNAGTQNDNSFKFDLNTLGYSNLQSISFWKWNGDYTIKEIRLYYTPTETLEISPTTATVVAGDTLTITATNPILNVKQNVEWTSNYPNIASVTKDENSQNGIVTAKSVGDVEITAQDDTATKTAEITVIPFTINNGDPSVQVIEGEKVQLTANNTNGSVTWSSSNTSVATVDESSGLVTAQGKSGKATITADHGNGVTDNIEVNVQSKKLSFSAEKTLLHIGDTTTFTVTPSDDVTYSFDKVGIVGINNDGIITALANGEVTITATRGTNNTTLTIKVAPITISQTNLKLSLNQKYTLTAENVVGTATWTSSNTNVVSVDENGVLTANGEGTATITLKDSTSGLATCEVEVVINEATVTLPSGATKVETITIKKSDNWKNKLENLPLTDGNGNKYTYYIVEKSNSDKYYPISYSENGINLKNDDVTSLMITNKSKDVEDSPAIMPETGGKGRVGYYTTGMTIILSSLIVYYLIKRHKKYTD